MDFIFENHVCLGLGESRFILFMPAILIKIITSDSTKIFVNYKLNHVLIFVKIKIKFKF